MATVFMQGLCCFVHPLTVQPNVYSVLSIILFIKVLFKKMHYIKSLYKEKLCIPECVNAFVTVISEEKYAFKLKTNSKIVTRAHTHTHTE